MDHVQLSEEEKYRVALQVDHFIELLSKRYGIEPTEVIDAVRWVKAHQNLENKLQFGALASLIGLLVGATMMALWEGIKHMVNGNNIR